MNKTVLIVEDNPFDQKLLARMADEMGVKKIVCNNGYEAVATLNSHGKEINLMFLDLNMPLVDGISVIGHCKSNHPNLPIVVVSATENLDDLSAIQSWKVNQFIAKPFPKDAIMAAMRHFLQENEVEAG